jgi:metallophosphoesterase superfamily enzyme
MKKIRVLALSDLHLGEEESLLNICEGKENIIQTTVMKIAELSKGRGKFEPGIEKLIFIGDIVELSEAKDEPAYNTTKFFLSALLSEVPVQEMIYLVGNHDHHLWVEALTQDQGKEDYRDCEPKTGVFIDDAEIFVRNCLPPDHSVGKITVGYPYYTM